MTIHRRRRPTRSSRTSRDYGSGSTGAGRSSRVAVRATRSTCTGRSWTRSHSRSCRTSAALASALDEHANVHAWASAALAIWRGPALADVALASAGRAEAERLEELRLRAYELRLDAELALGHHAEAIGEVQALVAQNPYRERFVAQLMLALYRSGRHAEALDVVREDRRRLDDDLGLQPSCRPAAVVGSDRPAGSFTRTRRHERDGHPAPARPGEAAARGSARRRCDRRVDAGARSERRGRTS